MPVDTPTFVFSYSREDSEFALGLANDLKKAGANVWIDQKDIKPGEDWDRAIEAAITRSTRILLILSPASVQNENVRDEIGFAINNKKIIIPVLYRDCLVPIQVTHAQQVDFRTDYASGLKILLKTLNVEPPSTKLVEFAPSSVLTALMQTELTSTLTEYAEFLSGLGLRSRFVPMIHVQEQAEPGYHSYLRGTDIFVLSGYARPANVLREYSHVVLLEPIGNPDDQWQYSAIEAGMASYLTADFLKSPIVDTVNLNKRFPISKIPHTYQGGQNEGSMGWGSFLWALREQFGSEKTGARIC